MLHSAYGGSWVIREPINSPGELAKGRCWVTVDIGDGLGEVAVWSEQLLLLLFSDPVPLGMFFPSAASLQEGLYKAMKSSASDNLKPPF